MSDKKNERTVLVWVDLETTGLKPITSHRILEYAVVFTDLHLNELDCLTGVIPQDVAFARSRMDDYVTKMHTKNGLLEELEAVEGNDVIYLDSLQVAQEEILALLKSVKETVITFKDCVTDDDVDVIFVIAGSTVGFDKGYLEHYMPKLFAELHYRQLDVSVYKVGFPEIFGTNTSVAHRAMDDIRASIAAQHKMHDLIEDAWKYEQLA